MKFFKKRKILIIIISVIAVTGLLVLCRNLSYEGLIYKLRDTGSQIRPILGEELKVKREYFASHTSFVFLVFAKVIASPTIKGEAYGRLLSGLSIDEAAKEAVDKMPSEEIGLVLEIDGVTVEFTRFRFEYVPQAIAAMQTELLKKDNINAQCDNPEYKNRMTFSKIVYIPKRNFLITVSNIKSLIEIRDNTGKLIARDYEAIPEEEFQEVVHKLEQI
jgi:hypothetical protein